MIGLRAVAQVCETAQFLTIPLFMKTDSSLKPHDNTFSPTGLTCLLVMWNNTRGNFFFIAAVIFSRRFNASVSNLILFSTSLTSLEHYLSGLIHSVEKGVLEYTDPNGRFSLVYICEATNLPEFFFLKAKL